MSVVTVSGVSSTYKVLSVEFVDTPEYHQRMAEILMAGRKVEDGVLPSLSPSDAPRATVLTDLPWGTRSHPMSAVSIPTTASPTSPSAQLSFSWVIPLSVIAVSVVVIGVCLVLYLQYERKRSRRYQVDGLSKTYRGDWELSTDAAVAAREELDAALGKAAYPGGLRAPGPGNFMPRRLTSISESPEDRLQAFRNGRPVTKLPEYLEDALSQDDSLVSMLSRLRFEFPPHSLSSIPPPYPGESPRYPDMSHSYPQSLNLTAQAPFSPYHLTYMSPVPYRGFCSDPNIVETTASMYGARPPSTVTSDGTGCRGSFTASWKSPYHPNYNTPNSSEGDNLTPGVAFHGGVVGCSDPSMLYKRADLDPAAAVVRELQIGMHMVDRMEDKSVDKMSVDTATTAQLTMVPGSVGSWQYNQLYMHPDPRLALNVRALPDMAPMLPPSSRRRPPPPRPDPACPECAAASGNTSVFPNIGSSNNSCYSGGPLGGGSVYPPPSYHLSTNTSLSVQQDSCETTAYSNSTVNGPFSQSTNSGYNASHSHSTSLEKGSVLASRTNSLKGMSGMPANTSLGVFESSCANNPLSTTTQSAPAAFGITSASDGLVWDSFGVEVSAVFPNESSRTKLTEDVVGGTNFSDCASGNETGTDVSVHKADDPNTSTRSTALNSSCVSQTPAAEDKRIEEPKSDGDHEQSAPSKTPQIQRLQMEGEMPSAPSSAKSLDWDTFPFYKTSAGGTASGTPGETRSGTPVTPLTPLTPVTPASSERGGPVLVLSLSAGQPILANAQYWV